MSAARLFVPLTAESFGWWKSGRKRWEVRRPARRWTRDMNPGRRVELRRGYSGPSLWGTLTGMSIDAPLRQLALFGLAPGDVALGSVSWDEVEVAIGGPTDSVIAFEVMLDPGQGLGT